MKRWKRALVSLLAGCLLCGMYSTGVRAAETGYTYQVTLSTGNMGLIGGADKVAKTEIEPGSRVTVDYDGVQVTDDRFYVKGIRLSGQDNAELVTNATFTATEDRDYVVVYGIKGDQVAYTVHYQDEAGNTLLQSRTYYGNVGDKPIVAYRYVDGYVPQAYALTKTLSENAAENVFTFVYVQGDPGTIVETVTETTTVTTGPEVITVVVGATQVTGGGGTGGGGTGGAGAEAAGEGGGEGAAEGGNIEEDAVPGGTQEIVDLDEDETPLADLEVDDGTASGLPMAFSVGIGAAAAVLLIWLAVWLVKGRKSGKDGTE